MRLSATFLSCFLSIAVMAQYHDWPMWRYNHGRSASSPEQFSDKLYQQWRVKYSARTPVWYDPLNQNLMQFDRIFEPIVADNKIFLDFNDQDKVIALDINSGKELWQYYADGHVRFPLAANNGNIYSISDDGYCYCLNADYEAKVKSWVRSYSLHRGKSFTITDKFELTGMGETQTSSNLKTYCWITDISPGLLRFEGDGFRLIMTYNQKVVKPKIEFIEVTNAL